MKPVPDFADFGGGLAGWDGFDSESKVDLHAHAVRVVDQLFFVDPIPLRADALDRLTADAAPAGVIVTNANHARAADAFRRRWRVPLWMHADAAAATGLTPDHTVPPGGGPVCGGVFQAVPLPGAAAGEIALHRAADVGHGGVMIVGDALIHLPSHGFTVLPDKYCDNAKELRRSLAALLEWEFGVMLFAHGEPIMRGARARLAALLAA